MRRNPPTRRPTLGVRLGKEARCAGRVGGLRHKKHAEPTLHFYNRRKVYIRAVLTHEQYDRGAWKRRK
ncbi:MAG: type II toxin-antitoxin system HigB family toxin [Gammaproteobacteria bacterium]|nr:type II toxin-antitoxin system HigB family toxin [Gammaproteobacteria bacterium]